MPIREVTSKDVATIRKLIYGNVGKGPYLDKCIRHARDPDGFTIVYDKGGTVVSFMTVLKGAKISRTDFDGYQKLCSLTDKDRVYTGYILVVDKPYSNNNIGHEMIAASFERLKKLGATQFYSECIVPLEWNEKYLAGKVHWLPRYFDINSLFYEYYPGFFYFTTSSDSDFCINCNGKCHCGAVVFLGELRR